MGTLFCVNVVVPHTGKAVEGVCPNVVQGCASKGFAKSTKMIKKRKWNI
jgi:hypothetical protein